MPKEHDSPQWPMEVFFITEQITYWQIPWGRTAVSMSVTFCKIAHALSLLFSLSWTQAEAVSYDSFTFISSSCVFVCIQLVQGSVGKNRTLNKNARLGHHPQEVFDQLISWSAVQQPGGKVIVWSIPWFVPVFVLNREAHRCVSVSLCEANVYVSVFGSVFACACSVHVCVWERAHLWLTGLCQQACNCS